MPSNLRRMLLDLPVEVLAECFSYLEGLCEVVPIVPLVCKQFYHAFVSFPEHAFRCIDIHYNSKVTVMHVLERVAPYVEVLFMTDSLPMIEPPPMLTRCRKLVIRFCMLSDTNLFDCLRQSFPHLETIHGFSLFVYPGNARAILALENRGRWIEKLRQQFPRLQTILSEAEQSKDLYYWCTANSNQKQLLLRRRQRQQQQRAQQQQQQQQQNSDNSEASDSDDDSDADDDDDNNNNSSTIDNVNDSTTNTDEQRRLLYSQRVHYLMEVLRLKRGHRIYIDDLIFSACTHRNLVLLEVLCNWPNIEASTSVAPANNPLICAIKNKFYSGVDVLLTANNALATRFVNTTIHGHSPMLEAIYRNKPDLVERLCILGANLDVPNYKSNPLHHCAQYGYIECAKVLLRYGCSTTAINSRQRTPATVARLRGYRELASLLERYSPPSSRVEPYILKKWHPFH